MKEADKKYLVVWGENRVEIFNTEKKRSIAKVSKDKSYTEALAAANDFIKRMTDG